MVVVVTVVVLLVGVVVVVGMACARWVARNGRTDPTPLVAPERAEFGWATARVRRSRSRRSGTVVQLSERRQQPGGRRAA